MKALYLLACAGLVGLVGCAADAESVEPAPGPLAIAPGNPVPTPTHGTVLGPAGGARVSAAALASGPSFVGALVGGRPAAFVCRPDAFCDDFEGAALGARWTAATSLAGGKIEPGTESASAGRGSLRLTTRDQGSTAYLAEAGPDINAAWSGVVSFALRVDELPATSLGGPELSVVTKDGPITLRVSLEPQGLVLHQLAPASCDRARCAPSATVVAPAQANHWYRVTVSLEVVPHQAAPYGYVHAAVDGGDAYAHALTVPMFDGPTTLRAGITEGDTRAAAAELDDVTLLVH
jgi:hypothetical protein